MVRCDWIPFSVSWAFVAIISCSVASTTTRRCSFSRVGSDQRTMQVGSDDSSVVGMTQISSRRSPSFSAFFSRVGKADLAMLVSRSQRWESRVQMAETLTPSPSPKRLVVPHILGVGNFFRTRSKYFPGFGQVVAALKTHPHCLGSWFVFWSIHEST